jgi:tRNA pseudouridine32 synthase / 23S rRNA pseudouridine746 synthase
LSPFLLHQDAHLAAVDKPAGRIVVPGRGPPERTVREEAEEALGPLWVVHRLDRGTSGVLLLARNAEAHRRACQAFERHQVTKRYLALVLGVLREATRVAVPIAQGRRGRMQAGSGPGARPASTFVRPVASFPAAGPFPDLTLVEAFPESGRTHQVRVHLAHLGHPLVVDPTYGGSEVLRGDRGAVLLDRTPLHAASLEMLHPVDGTPLRIEAPLPADLEGVLAAAQAARGRPPGDVQESKSG